MLAPAGAWVEKRDTDRRVPGRWSSHIAIRFSCLTLRGKRQSPWFCVSNYLQKFIGMHSSFNSLRHINSLT